MEPGNYIFISDSYSLNPGLVGITSKYRGYLESILITNGTINDRIQRLAYDILQDAIGKNVVFLCVLRGAFRFCKDLIEKIDQRIEDSSSSYKLDFIRARSYVNDTQEEVIVEGIDSLNLEGKDVIIIEDMVDKGKTLLKLSQEIKAKNPASLKIAVLAYKRNPENTFIMPDFIGFSLPDK